MSRKRDWEKERLRTQMARNGSERLTVRKNATKLVSTSCTECGVKISADSPKPRRQHRDGCPEATPSRRPTRRFLLRDNTPVRLLQNQAMSISFFKGQANYPFCMEGCYLRTKEGAAFVTLVRPDGEKIEVWLKREKKIFVLATLEGA